MMTTDGLRIRVAIGLPLALVLASVFHPVGAQVRENLPVDLPDGPAKRGFDIERFSNAGNGWFETFYVDKTERLADVLAAERVAGDTRVLVLETAAGQLALLQDQMAFHHIAEGRAGDKDWMATF
jgi:hypothetical protein